MRFGYPFKEDQRISQYFGENVDYYKSRYGSEGHSGIDWACEEGTLLLSVMDGEVFRVDWNHSAYGISVRIRNESHEAVYAHMSGVHVMVGDRVKKGSKIGLSGNTGASTGPHLHLAIRELLPSGSVKNYDNGHWGYFNFLPDLDMPNKEYISDWALDSWTFCVDNKILDGKDPQKNVTKEEIAVVLYRFYEKFVRPFITP